MTAVERVSVFGGTMVPRVGSRSAHAECGPCVARIGCAAGARTHNRPFRVAHTSAPLTSMR